MPRARLPRPGCLFCGKEVKAAHYLYCDNHCQMEYQHKVYIERWLASLETGRKAGYYEVSAHVKRWLRETRGERCAQCGWAERNPFTDKIPLEVSHVDGDTDNCRPDNMRLLCPNCHSLTETHERTSGRQARRPSRGRRRIAGEA